MKITTKALVRIFSRNYLNCQKCGTNYLLKCRASDKMSQNSSSDAVSVIINKLVSDTEGYPK
jgi:hypothetical protein